MVLQQNQFREVSLFLHKCENTFFNFIQQRLTWHCIRNNTGLCTIPDNLIRKQSVLSKRPDLLRTNHLHGLGWMSMCNKLDCIKLSHDPCMKSILNAWFGSKGIIGHTTHLTCDKIFLFKCVKGCSTCLYIITRLKLIDKFARHVTFTTNGIGS